MRSRPSHVAASYQAIMRGGEVVSAIAAFYGEMQARHYSKTDDLVKKN